VSWILPGRSYVAKRDRYLDGGVNVVEIGLTRSGDPLTLIPDSWRQEWVEPGRRRDHEVAVWRACVTRISDPWSVR
jgi:hypothetical protein